MTVQEGSTAPFIAPAPKFGKVAMSPEHSSSSINSVGDGKLDKEMATGWQMPGSSKGNDSGSGSGSFCGSVCHEESSKDVGTLFSGELVIFCLIALVCTLHHVQACLCFHLLISPVCL